LITKKSKNLELNTTASEENNNYKKIIVKKDKNIISKLLKILVWLFFLIIIIIGLFFLIRSIKKSSMPEEKSPLPSINKEAPTQIEPVISVIRTYLLDETAPDPSEVIVQGRFNGVEQAIKGKALFVKSNEKTYLRFEEFESINGQDIHVYLSPVLNLDKNDVIDLGLLKSLSGNFNYELEENINIEKYRNVIIWSNPFDAFFGYASLLSKELPPESKPEMTEEEKAQQDAENNPQMPPPIPDETVEEVTTKAETQEDATEKVPTETNSVIDAETIQ